MTQAPTSPLAIASAEETAEVSFDRDMNARIETVLSRYPEPGAALLPVLWICQERWGWISAGIIRAVGERLGMSPAFVEGVVSFYSMYRRAPPGRYLLQVCTTLSCELCGTAALVEHIRKRLGIDFGATTADGNFTLVDVQCLGACGEAPVIQINDDYYTGLSVDSLDRILNRLAES
jgi:NADH-quinone oxidoreductase E subunit